MISRSTNSRLHWPKAPRVLAAIVCFIFLGRADSTDAKVVPIPLVPGVDSSPVYKLYVNGTRIPVGSEVANGMLFATASFLFSEEAEIRVDVNDSFDDVKIRPLRFNHAKRVKRDRSRAYRRRITFPLSKPQHLILEFSGLPPLVLINSRLGDKVPNPKDPNVLYFGPGVHEPGRIRVKSNQTVYLAPGAKVYGTIEGTCVENVRVTGRGHLYGTKHTKWSDRTYGIIFDRSKNITIENIGIRDCYWWVTEFLLCDGVTIDNINMLSFNRNNGGLMIDSCSNLTARDSLLMAMDDCICPHALNAAGNGEVVSDNMLFERLVLYNVYTGNAIRIGASFETSEVRNWTFRDIDVVHRRGAAIYADHSDWATVKNLRFENFYDEATLGPSIDMRIDKTNYSCKTGYRNERGRFDGLVFSNVQSAGGPFVLRGYDKKHGFDNVLFADCRIGGKPVSSIKDIQVNKFVRNVRFTKAPAAEDAAALAQEDTQTGATQDSPEEIVIDDGDPGFRAFGFSAVDSPVDAHQGDALIGKVQDEFGHYAAAIYEPKIDGEYEVHAYWGTHQDKDPQSAWVVRHRDGYSRVYLDQNASPGWHSLGTFRLDKQSNVRLLFPNYFNPTTRPVIADAVRFRRKPNADSKN